MTSEYIRGRQSGAQTLSKRFLVVLKYFPSQRRQLLWIAGCELGEVGNAPESRGGHGRDNQQRVVRFLSTLCNHPVGGVRMEIRGLHRILMLKSCESASFSDEPVTGSGYQAMEDGWSLPCTVRGNYSGEESLTRYLLWPYALICSLVSQGRGWQG
jgi:hypothetical protein